MTKLKVGDRAPGFSGKTQDGKEIKLDDFNGKKLLLYFYPKDDTSGCTAEACNLNDNYQKWLDMGFEVVGVSPDSIESHMKFKNKYGLNFNLIADINKEILQAYDVWGEKSMYGKKYMGVLRTTFIIDKNGIIQNIFEKVETKDHSNQIIKDLKI